VPPVHSPSLVSRHVILGDTFVKSVYNVKGFIDERGVRVIHMAHGISTREEMHRNPESGNPAIFWLRFRFRNPVKNTGFLPDSAIPIAADLGVKTSNIFES
jgi:hypothetical protein